MKLNFHSFGINGGNCFEEVTSEQQILQQISKIYNQGTLLRYSDFLCELQVKKKVNNHRLNSLVFSTVNRMIQTTEIAQIK